MNLENDTNEKHYICLGGCRGVSQFPGVCQTADCANHQHELIECHCTDGQHNDFLPLPIKEEKLD